MTITYLGIVFKDEPWAFFSVDFDIYNNGVCSSGMQGVFVSLPMLGINDGREELTESELEIAKQMVMDELKKALWLTTLPSQPFKS